jgi:hypothetical protein
MTYYGEETYANADIDAPVHVGCEDGLCMPCNQDSAYAMAWAEGVEIN